MTPRSAGRIELAQAASATIQPRTTRGFVVAVTVVVSILVLQLAVALVGAVIGEQESERAAYDTFAYVGDITAERVSRYAEGVTDTVEITAIELAANHTDIDYPALGDALYARLLGEPHVRALFVGFADGSLVAVARQGEGFVEHRIMVQPQRLVQRINHNAQFEPMSFSTVDTGFDPRAQEWYVAGEQAPGTIWTDPYVLSTTGVPATIAARAVWADGELVGVVGADLSIDALATVLDELPVGEGAHAFVLSRDRRVIAAPSRFADSVTSLATITGQVPFGVDLGVDEALGSLTREGGNSFGTIGERYILERGLLPGEGPDWLLHLEADRRQLSPGLERVQLTVAWVSGLSALIVLVASVLLYRLWTPLERLRIRASTDALTGLANRHEFERRGNRLVAAAHRHGDPVVAATFDLDDFKAINDTHGHHVGDRALSVAGQSLLASVRDRDVAARIGGDEFVVIHRVHERGDPHPMVERIRNEVSAQLTERVLGGEAVGVTAGYSVTDGRHGDLAMLLKEADHALVAGKRTQKGATHAHAAAGERLGQGAGAKPERRSHT